MSNTPKLRQLLHGLIAHSYANRTPQSSNFPTFEPLESRALFSGSTDLGSQNPPQQGIILSSEPLTAPAAPTSVAASNGTYTNQIRVTWTASTNATAYEVWRGTTDSSAAAVRIADNVITTVFESNTGQAALTAYYFWVKAKNSAGTSDFSLGDPGYLAAPPVTIPAAPTNVQASNGTFAEKIQLTWTASANATAYEVWRGTTDSSAAAVRIAENVTTTAFESTTGQVPNTAYYFWVKAKNSAGASAFSLGDPGYLATPPVTAPAAPTAVAASNGTYTNQIRVTWTASATATAYEVWRGTTDSSAAAVRIAENVTNTVFESNTGQAANTAYYFWVKAKNSAGTSDFSLGDPGYLAAPPVTIPAAPTNVQASNGTFAEKIQITWTASATATAYEVWRGTTDSSAAAVRIAENVTTTAFESTAGQVANTAYYFWVKAKNSAGASAFSLGDPGYLATPPVTAPAAPTNVQASDGTYTNQIRVTWTASANATAYEVWRGTTDSSAAAVRIAENVTNTVFESTTGQAANTAYYFWVKAKNATGVSPFSLGNVGYLASATPVAPVAPTNVQASDGTYTNQIRVTWASVPNAAAYEVWRGTTDSSAAAVRIAENVTNTVFESTTGQAANTAYYFWVKAKNATGASPFSLGNVGYLASATPVAPVAPTNVQASDGTYTNQIRVTWTSVPNAAAYEVWRGTTDSSAAAVRIAENVTNTVFESNTGQAANTAYYFWVKAKNATGASPFSLGNVGYLASPTPTAPAAPTNVQASDGAYTNQIRVTWTSVPNAAAYEVWRGTTDSSAAAVRVAENVTGTVFESNTGQAANTPYYFWVKAKNATGVSPFSLGNVGYLAAPAAPAAPTNLLASNGTFPDKIQLTWTASANAAAYEIWRGTTDSSAAAVRIAENITTTSFDSLTGQLAGTPYYFWVKAKNIGGVSGFSLGDPGYLGA
jgi:hypothetical protein